MTCPSELTTGELIGSTGGRCPQCQLPADDIMAVALLALGLLGLCPLSGLILDLIRPRWRDHPSSTEPTGRIIMPETQLTDLTCPSWCTTDHAKHDRLSEHISDDGFVVYRVRHHEADVARIPAGTRSATPAECVATTTTDGTVTYDPHR